MADAFRSAFIAANLMTEWHSAFTSGSVINRVLRITYSTGKTYGDCYYWFQFTNAGFWFQVTTGWNTSTNIPTGTQWLDFYSNTTSSPSGRQMHGGSMSPTTNAELIRYTSQANSTHSYFILRQSTSQNILFAIAHPSHQVASWVDLDKTFFSHFILPGTSTSGSSATLNFNSLFALRRSYGIGTTLNATSSYGHDYNICTASYSIPGRSTSFINNLPNGSSYNFTSVQMFSLLLPNGLTSANPAYTANYNPVITGVPYSFYMTNSQLPSDFGIIPTYANNTLAPGDTFVVTAGVEEWEILIRSNASGITTAASIAFGARTI